MRLNPEVYRRAMIAAEALKTELEPLVLGKKRGAWSCGCGAFQHGAATATKIMPAGMNSGHPEYEDHISLWYMWSVSMREDDSKLAPDDYSYSTGLNDFVEVSLLREAFLRHFNGINVSVVGS